MNLTHILRIIYLKSLHFRQKFDLKIQEHAPNVWEVWGSVGELGLDFLGGSKVYFSVLIYRHMVQSFGIYSKVRFALILLNSTEENTRRPSLCLRCLNLFMHDPYFLTWIIRTDFFGDFVQFHAVYTKNIHKLENFLGHIDVVFVYWRDRPKLFIFCLLS